MAIQSAFLSLPFCPSDPVFWAQGFRVLHWIVSVLSRGQEKGEQTSSETLAWNVDPGWRGRPVEGWAEVGEPSMGSPVPPPHTHSRSLVQKGTALDFASWLFLTKWKLPVLWIYSLEVPSPHGGRWRACLCLSELGLKMVKSTFIGCFLYQLLHVLFEGSLHIFGLQHYTDRLSDPSACFPTFVEVFLYIKRQWWHRIRTNAVNAWSY